MTRATRSLQLSGYAGKRIAVSLKGKHWPTLCIYMLTFHINIKIYHQYFTNWIW